MENVSIRLQKSLMKDAERLARLAMVDKSTIIREALDKGFADVKLKVAVELFAGGLGDGGHGVRDRYLAGAFDIRAQAGDDRRTGAS